VAAAGTFELNLHFGRPCIGIFNQDNMKSVFVAAMGACFESFLKYYFFCISHLCSSFKVSVHGVQPFRFKIVDFNDHGRDALNKIKNRLISRAGKERKEKGD